MVNPDEYASAYNELHGRMIAAAEDRSIPPEIVREWESETLEFVDEAFRSAGSQLSRNPEFTRLEHRTNIKLCATNALGIRRQWGMGDAAFTRHEQARRLSELKSDYLKIRQVNPGVFGDMYLEELQYIEHELKVLKSASFSPLGCVLLLAIVVFVVVLLVK